MSENNPETIGAKAVAANPFAIERKTILARDAGSGEVLREIVCASPEEIKDAVRRARVAQRDWGSRTVHDRVRLLRPVLDRIVAKRDELARLISVEVGKPRIEALSGEVLATCEALDFVFKNGPELLRPEKVPHRLMKLTRSYAFHEPWGVVGLITPWNYPFFITASIAFSALVAGNSVVNKPSELTPLVGLELETILRDCGLPPALYQCLPGAADVGAALVQAGCDKISFTGSVATGRKVGAACGEKLIPVSLELGGKDPAIVLDDAPLERAARAIVWASFVNAGQVCASVERIFVQDTIAKEFTDLLVRHTLALRHGRDSTFETDVGPLASRAQWELVNRQVEQAQERGAIVLTGGRGTRGVDPKGGWFYEPTILANVKDDMSVQREETFGPVVTIVPVSGEEEALRKANDSQFGLTASVWTKDERRGARMAQRLEFGSVYVNDALMPSAAGEVSWGGVKASGHGRTRGPDGLLAMTRVKHVSYDRFRLRDNPLWFPYSDQRYRRCRTSCRVCSARARRRAALGARAIGYALLRPEKKKKKKAEK